MAVGVKGVESEVQRSEAKENPILKTKDRRLGVFLCSIIRIHSLTPPSFKK